MTNESCVACPAPMGCAVQGSVPFAEVTTCATIGVGNGVCAMPTEAFPIEGDFWSRKTMDLGPELAESWTVLQPGVPAGHEVRAVPTLAVTVRVPSSGPGM